MLIGAVPPAALSDWRYLATALVAGAITFSAYRLIDRLQNPVLVFDALGLALFAVSGTQKALAYRLSPIMAPLIGMVTAIGGGMLRDVLLSEVPAVLRSDLYAVAALAGAAVVVGGQMLHFPSAVTAFVGAAVCFTWRMLAIRYSLRLPTAQSFDRRERSSAKPDRH